MSEEKKIIIDEDWKTQVETEKEELERKRRGEAGGEAAAHAAAGEPGEMKMPPASFEMLLSTLATEAMVALGQIPHPATGRAEPNLDQAKFFIGTIDMLEQKTKGNLSPLEEQGLEDLLHQLRIAYVAVQNRP